MVAVVTCERSFKPSGCQLVREGERQIWMQTNKAMEEQDKNLQHCRQDLSPSCLFQVLCNIFGLSCIGCKLPGCTVQGLAWGWPRCLGSGPFQ